MGNGQLALKFRARVSVAPTNDDRHTLMIFMISSYLSKLEGKGPVRYSSVTRPISRVALGNGKVKDQSGIAVSPDPSPE